MLKKRISLAMAIVIALSTLLCLPVFASENAGAHDEAAPEQANAQAGASAGFAPTISVVDDAIDPELMENAVQREIIFSSYHREAGLSDRDIGVRKLVESGLSQFAIEAFDDETLEMLATADKCIQMVSYYGEVYDEASDETELVSISQADFIATEREKLDDLDVDQNFASLVFPENPAGEQNAVSPMAQHNFSVNNGRLAVLTNMYSFNHSYYGKSFMPVSQFIWTTMPKFRGTDTFSITRDGHTVEIPGGFTGRIKYTEKRRYYWAAGGRVYSADWSDVNHDKTLSRDSNVSGATNLGYGIRYSVPADSNPPATMLNGWTYIARRYVGLQGLVSYKGTFRYTNPSSFPQRHNHYITYLHQNGTKIGLTPSFSVSFSEGFGASVSPTFAPKFNRIALSMLTSWSRP